MIGQPNRPWAPMVGRAATKGKLRCRVSRAVFRWNLLQKRADNKAIVALEYALTGQLFRERLSDTFRTLLAEASGPVGTSATLSILMRPSSRKKVLNPPITFMVALRGRAQDLVEWGGGQTDERCLACGKGGKTASGNSGVRRPTRSATGDTGASRKRSYYDICRRGL